MNQPAQFKKVREIAPYVIVAAVGLLLGSVLMEVFNGGSNKPGIVWEVYSEAAVKAAKEQKKPIMIYFAADWCGPCQILRRDTFTDPDVRAEAERFARFKVDLTKDEPATAAIQAQYAIATLPAVVFIDSTGKEKPLLRMVGVEEAARFRQRMKAIQ